MRYPLSAALACLFALCSLTGPVRAAVPATQAAQTSSAPTITGTVASARGTGLAGADVTATGPVTVSAQTDAAGHFAIAAPPGFYTITVTHGGYQTASTQVAITAGAPTAVNVTLQETTLSTLTTIGRTSTSGSGNQARFDIGSSAQATLSMQQFQNLDQPAITNLIATLPGINASESATNVNNSFLIHGLLNETKVTLDGHPVSSGVSGTYTADYTGSGIIGGVDVLYGMGLNGPTAGQSGVGTINFRTPDFTAQDSGFVKAGKDSYNGSLYTILLDRNFDGGKISMILGRSFDGYRGPSYDHDVDVIDGTNGMNTATTVIPQTFNYTVPSFTNLAAEGLYDASNTYVLTDNLAKLRFSFSGATQLTLEYVGFYGQFDPQGGAYGQYIGQNTVPECVNKVSGAFVGASGAGCTLTSIYQAPSVQNQIGTTQGFYTFYPGSAVRFSQPSLNADFRTTIGNDTVLFRPYTADITRNIDGTGESEVPGEDGNGWFQVISDANCTVQFSAPTATGGAKGPCFPAGAGINTLPYVNNPTVPHTYGTTTTPYTCTAATPCYTTGTAQDNAGQYGYGTPYSTNEYDHLNGYTFSYIHPVGANTYSFSVDHFLDDTIQILNDTSTPLAGCTPVIKGGAQPPVGTIGYQPNCLLNSTNGTAATASLPTTDIGTPDTQIYQTDISLTGQFQLTPKLEFDWGNYLTTYKTNVTFENPAIVAAFQAAYPGSANNAYINEQPVDPVSELITKSHYDPHFGFVFRPDRDTAVRLNGGSSVVVPYSTLISGYTTINEGASSTTVTVKNPFLEPEEVVGYDLGSDRRLSNGAVFSGDLWYDTVHNPWLTETTVEPIAYCQRISGQCFQSSTLNGPQRISKGAQLSITDQPRLGWGYYGNLTLEHVYYENLPASYFGTATKQTNIDGLEANGVPYATAYASAQFAFPHNGLVRLGVDYEGNDNEYNVPAFYIFDMTAHVDVGAGFQLQLSGQNIFNRNFGNDLVRAIEYQGQVQIGYSSVSGYGEGQVLGIIEPPFQTFTLSISHHF
ncbi:MAG TPA: carboxypeptidase regulatory-like domain-containing protein [Candidatus Sulfotelmatobacter sp.]|nr:carboxypeptidase regulatory-like domain-containing protein [Candidatus Sulfotelmatobacter sp.]